MKKISVIVFTVVFLTGSICSVADGITEKEVTLKAKPAVVKQRTSIRPPKKISSLNKKSAAPSAITAITAPTQQHSIWTYSDATRSWQPYSYP